MTDLLDELLASTRERVAAARRAAPLEAIRDRVTSRVSLVPSFRDALAAPGVRVIAEVKRASPSRGELAAAIDAGAQGRAYVAAGVAAVSVLTEPTRFKGTLDDLATVAASGVPTLRKDFIVDEYQLWEAADRGAAAVLLIVAALPQDELEHLHHVAGEVGLDVMVEVHDDSELARALRLHPSIVGINARDLRTFEVDRGAFARLRTGIPDGVIAVAESGIRDADDLREAAAEGADAVLVGESLVTAADPEAAARLLVAAGLATAEVIP